LVFREEEFFAFESFRGRDRVGTGQFEDEAARVAALGAPAVLKRDNGCCGSRFGLDCQAELAILGEDLR
jgi:hypothetical protein